MKFNINFLKKLPSSEKRITLPTIITMLRIGLVPIIILLIINKYFFEALLIIIISAISDFLDGMLARMLNQKTTLGAWLDPIADKLFIVSCYIVLSLGYLANYKLPVWFSLLVFLKEVFLILGAIFIYRVRGWVDVKPTWLGKLTMDIQTIFIVMIFINYFFNFHFERINNFFIFVIMILIFSSFYQYAKIGMKQLGKLS